MKEFLYVMSQISKPIKCLIVNRLVTTVESKMVICRTQKILFWVDTPLLQLMHLLDSIFTNVRSSIFLSFGGYVAVHPRNGIKRGQFPGSAFKKKMKLTYKLSRNKRQESELEPKYLQYKHALNPL